MIAAHFWPWARAEHRTPCVPVNVRITPPPVIVCVRQEDIDAARLRELTLQLDDLMAARAAAPDGEECLAAIHALVAWDTDHKDEFLRLKNGVAEVI